MDFEISIDDSNVGENENDDANDLRVEDLQYQKTKFEFVIQIFIDQKTSSIELTSVM